MADIRALVADAKALRQAGGRTVVFIDELHRFNKSQQDALLPHVEDGTIVLIGATTENPYYEINSPLLSRLRASTGSSRSVPTSCARIVVRRRSPTSAGWRAASRLTRRG